MRVRCLSFTFLGLLMLASPVMGQAESVVDVRFFARERDLRFDEVGDYHRIWIWGQTPIWADSLVGKPDLPVIHTAILLPPNTRVSGISVATDAAAVVLPGDWLPIPVQPDSVEGAEDDLVGGDSEVYDSETPYPPSPVWIEDIAIMRGIQLLVVAITPLQYIGAERELRFFPELDLSVQCAPAFEEEGYVRHRQRITSLWTRRGYERQWLGRHVSNFADDFGRFYLGFHDDSDLASVTESRPANGFNPMEFPSTGGSPVEYVIITDSLRIDGIPAGDMVSEFQRLADWKTARGVTAVVRTVGWIEEHYDGLDTAERIRNFIIDAYELWGTDWVLLGGDEEVVPARRLIRDGTWGPGDAPADAYYGCLDGTWNADGDFAFGERGDSLAIDIAWEVFVGRAPVETAEEATNFVNKILSYERAPTETLGDVGTTYDRLLLLETLTNSSWWDEDESFANGIWVGGQIYQLAVHQPYLERLFYIEPITDATIDTCCFYQTQRGLRNDIALGNVIPWTSTRNVLNEVNEGVGLVHHMAHSWPYHHGAGKHRRLGNEDENCPTHDIDDCNRDLDLLVAENIPISQIEALRNKDRYPVVYSTGSGANSYTQECVAEAWITAEDAGAAAVIATPHSAAPSLPTYEGQAIGIIDTTFFAAVLRDEFLHVGQALGLAEQDWQLNSRRNPQVITYQLLGDPEMLIWTETPDTLAITVSPDEIPDLGRQDVTVTVRTTSGSPVRDALVCLMQGTGVDLYASSFTQADGKAIFSPIVFTSSESVLITASAPNHWPDQQTIGLAEGTSGYLAYTEHTFSDDDGNENGMVDAGETIGLDVKFTNVGGSTITDDVETLLHAYAPLDLALTFNGMQQPEDVYIGAEGAHPGFTHGLYRFPMRREIGWSGDIGEPDGLGEKPEGVFIWRDPDDLDLWTMVVYRGMRRESLFPITMASGFFAMPEEFSDVEALGFEGYDALDTSAPDTLGFVLYGYGDPDTIRFRSSLEWITLTDSTHTFAAGKGWSPDESRTATFEFSTDPKAPDRSDILFEVQAEGEGGELLGENFLTIGVAAPRIVYSDQIIYYRWPWAGDTLYIVVPTVTNLGSGVGDSVCATIAKPPGAPWGNQVTILQSAAKFIDVPPGESEWSLDLPNNWFRFLGETDEDPTLFGQIKFDLTVNNYASGNPSLVRECFIGKVDYVPPPRVEDVVTTMRTGEGVSLNWDDDEPMPSDHWGYTIRRGISDRLNLGEPTPIRHFVDRSAERGASYTYHVASVDSSGNRSSWVSASEFPTWTPLKEGWPRRMEREGAAGSVRVVDLIPGDSDSLEIVAVGDQVYCWRADGRPCFTGNQQELADGVAYPIEADSTYFFDHGRFWSSPVVGDLDGDDDLEIVALSFQGVLYALEIDETPGADSLKVRWSRDFGGETPHAGMTLADLDGAASDSLWVIFNLPEYTRLYIYDADGAAVSPDSLSSCENSDWESPTACAMYNYGVADSWFTPVYVRLPTDDRYILMGLSNGKLAWVDDNGISAFEYDTGLHDAVVSTPAISYVDEGRPYAVFAAHQESNSVPPIERDSSGVYVVSFTDGEPIAIWEGLGMSDSLSLEFSENKYIQVPSLANIDDDPEPEILIGRDEDESSGLLDIRRFQRVFVLDETDSTAVACSLTVAIPSRGIDLRHVWSQASVMRWGDDYRIFAGSKNQGVMSWLWSSALGACDAGVENDQWNLLVGEEVLGTPILTDVDADGKLDVVAADVGGRVWVWEFDVAYADSLVEWGEFGHDPRNTFTYVVESPQRIVAGAPTLALGRNLPNPFNPRTTIEYRIADRANVSLRIFDVGGRLVRTLVEDVVDPGIHRVDWAGRDEAKRKLSSGVYFYRLETEGQALTRRLLLLR